MSPSFKRSRLKLCFWLWMIQLRNPSQVYLADWTLVDSRCCQADNQEYLLHYHCLYIFVSTEHYTQPSTREIGKPPTTFLHAPQSWRYFIYLLTYWQNLNCMSIFSDLFVLGCYKFLWLIWNTDICWRP